MEQFPLQIDGLPKTYVEAFRRTHISNIKEVDKAQSRESGVQDVGDQAESAIVPEVQEKWVDGHSHDLYVSSLVLYIQYLMPAFWPKT